MQIDPVTIFPPFVPVLDLDFVSLFGCTDFIERHKSNVFYIFVTLTALVSGSFRYLQAVTVAILRWVLPYSS